MPSQFRKDINGLRAIAVLLVIIFHFLSFNSLTGSSVFHINGGYVGVDIFFVISGFLMTSIILRGVNNNNFKLLDFWKRRAKRICPALFTAVALTYLITFLLLVNVKDFYEFNKEALLALTFVSNFRFAFSDGYFDVGSMNKILLHTWSLSVEWQFYLFYPIILLVISKMQRTLIKPVVVALFVISLALSLYYSQDNSYFLLHTRAWELLAGGIVYLFPLNKLQLLSYKKKLLIEILGLILIVSILFRTDSKIWSTLVVLPSVLGAMLVIATNNEKSILSNKPMQYLGELSYSLYIYHWIVLSIFSRINLINDTLLCLFVIGILAILSYHLIDKRRNYAWKFLIAYALLIALVQITINHHGFKSRYHIEIPFGAGVLPFPIEDIKPCFNNPFQKTQILLLGDSHAKHYVDYFTQNKVNIQIISNNGTYCYSKDKCIGSKKYFIDPITKQYGSLENYFNLIDNTIAKQEKTVPIIISHRWYQHFKDNYQNLEQYLNIGIGKLISKYPDRHFIVVGSLFGVEAIDNITQCHMIKDHNKYLPTALIDTLNCQQENILFDDKFRLINNHIKAFTLHHPNVSFIDPNPAICKDNYCRLFDDNGNPLFSDDNHLSIYGANFIGNKIFEALVISIQSNQDQLNETTN
ncbi:MAG: acyltransferase family protein [Succinivibrio sp.]|nr:acyltransferase family protein [Succinivibrio sp.]